MKNAYVKIKHEDLQLNAETVYAYLKDDAACLSASSFKPVTAETVSKNGYLLLSTSASLRIEIDQGVSYIAVQFVDYPF